MESCSRQGKECSTWRIAPLLASVLLVLLQGTFPKLFAMEGNTLQTLKKEAFSFRSQGNELKGEIVFPNSGQPPFPVIVFIHGSGPAKRDGYGHYPPVMETMAEQGFACLAWDKPGVGSSTGDYTTQDWMGESRSQEIVDAIELLSDHRAIASSAIGLWGISQAGWIFPKVLTRIPNISFVIAVSCPGGTVAEQLLFSKESDLKTQQWPDDMVKIQIDLEEALFEEVRQNRSFKSILASLEGKKDSVSRLKKFLDSRGQKIHFPTEKNYLAIQRIVQKGLKPNLKVIYCPTLLILGGKDRLVDIHKSEIAYRRGFSHSGNRQLTIRVLPDCDHDMNEDGQISQDYISALSQWLRTMSKKSAR